MKTISGAFMTMLQTSAQLVMADLYTITLASGTVLRYTSAQQSIVYGGNTYTAAYLDNAPSFKRGQTKVSIGLNADDLEIDILFDAQTRILNQLPASFAAAGGFDGAIVKVDKALAPDWTNPTVNGVVNLFTGIVAEAKCDAQRVSLTVNSMLRVLNVAFPRNYFTPQDNNAAFDAASGLSPATYAVNGTVSGTPTTTAFNSNCTQASDYFALGYVVWNTGANAGLKSLVKAYSQTSGAFTLVYPLPVAPSSGDTFTAYPGYDRTLATCIAKFNNKANFRGFPFVPTPETLELGSNGSPPRGFGGGNGAGAGGLGRGGGGLVNNFKVR